MDAEERKRILEQLANNYDQMIVNSKESSRRLGRLEVILWIYVAIKILIVVLMILGTLK